MNTKTADYSAYNEYILTLITMSAILLFIFSGSFTAPA